MTIYRFQQADYGALWAIPVEPVHPNTRGMFIHANEAGGWNATPCAGGLMIHRWGVTVSLR